MVRSGSREPGGPRGAGAAGGPGWVVGLSWWEPVPAGRGVPRASPRAGGVGRPAGRPPFWSPQRSACRVEPVREGRAGRLAGERAEEGPARAAEGVVAEKLA